MDWECSLRVGRRDCIWHSSLLAGQNYASQSPGDKKKFWKRACAVWIWEPTCRETPLCAWTCGEHVQNVVVWDQGVRTPILHPPICEFICLLSICTGTAGRRDCIWHSSLLAGQNYASQSPGDKKKFWKRACAVWIWEPTCRKGIASGYVECIASGYASCIASGYLNINIIIIIIIVVVVVIVVNNRHISWSSLSSSCWPSWGIGGWIPHHHVVH